MQRLRDAAHSSVWAGSVGRAGRRPCRAGLPASRHRSQDRTAPFRDFRSVPAMRAATLEELARLRGFGIRRPPGSASCWRPASDGCLIREAGMPPRCGSSGTGRKREFEKTALRRRVWAVGRDRLEIQGQYRPLAWAMVAMCPGACGRILSAAPGEDLLGQSSAMPWPRNPGRTKSRFISHMLGLGRAGPRILRSAPGRFRLGHEQASVRRGVTSRQAASSSSKFWNSSPKSRMRRIPGEAP